MSFKNQLTKLKDNWLLIVLVIVVLFIVSGLFNGSGTSYAKDSLQNISYNKSMGMFDSYAGESLYSSGGSNFAPDVEDRMIVKSARLSVEVKYKTFKNAEDKLHNIVSSTDSYFLNENSNSKKLGNKSIYSGSYSIKVESDKLDSVMSQLKEIGLVTSANLGQNDITGTYENKEINLQLEKDRLLKYQEIYDNSADMNDKLTLTDRMFNQERTIKYLEDSINNIDQRVEYSTINLSISENYNYSNVVFVKLSDLVRSLVNSINILLKIIFVLLPFAIVGYLGYLLFRKKKSNVFIKKN